jgi:hypothetical protein
MRKPDPNRDRGNDAVFIALFATLVILAALAVLHIGGR